MNKDIKLIKEYDMKPGSLIRLRKGYIFGFGSNVRNKKIVNNLRTVRMNSVLLYIGSENTFNMWLFDNNIIWSSNTYIEYDILWEP